MIRPPGADLANLFRSPEPDEPFRQGVILSFNPSTGANSVEVGGAVLTNLPVFESSGVVNLTAGDVVILLKFRSSWGILGRINVPGGADIASSAVSFVTAIASASGFGVTSGAYVTKAEATITVPVWANRVAFVVNSACGAKNTTAALDLLNAFIEIDPFGNGQTPFTNVPAGHWQTVYPAAAGAANVTPGSTFGARLKAATSLANWTADASNRVSINGVFLFSKV